MFSWLLRPLHINQMLFYHRPDPMLVLEINSVVGFVANYLYLVLGYLGKFLYYKALTGWPWGNLLKKKNYSHIQVTVILPDRIHSLGHLMMPTLTLAVSLSLFLLLKLNQSNKKSFSKGENLPQFWEGFIWITLGYGNLGLKSPLYWKQLNHTKDNQSNNTRKLGYVPYRWWCQCIISLKDRFVQSRLSQTTWDILGYI